ncbi:MAG: YceI family protein [Leeuwenhoekiella sp.]
MKTIKSILILALAATTVAFTNNLVEKVTVKESTLTWTGKKVTGQHNGTIDLKSGYFEMNGEAITGGEFVIDMTSIACTDLEGDSKGKLEGHLKSDDFFGVKNHPEATLVIKDAKKMGSSYEITGDLTIKTTTEPVTFKMQKAANTMVGSLTIDRSKYDVRYGSGSFFDNLGDKTIYDDFTLDIKLAL